MGSQQQSNANNDFIWEKSGKKEDIKKRYEGTVCEELALCFCWWKNQWTAEKYFKKLTNKTKQNNYSVSGNFPKGMQKMEKHIFKKMY